jgi:alkylhydroperoxidase family enzyme
MSRIDPALPPYSLSIQTYLDKLMPEGMEPLYLFRVLARDERLFARFMSSGLLDRGHLSIRERELVILRVCANEHSEYEWGVHVTQFAKRAGLDPEQVAATCDAERGVACWSERDRLLLAMCDELSAGTKLSAALWRELAQIFSDEARLELLLLAGFYRVTCVLTNSLELPLEPFAARFPSSGLSAAISDQAQRG